MKRDTRSNAIVLCCTADWLPYAAVALLSCVRQGADKIADLHVAVLGATAADRHKFSKFVEDRGFSASLIDAILPNSITNFQASRFSLAALLRLKLDELLPSHYERVLYLDSDILAEGPIADAFNLDLKGKCLGAVEDYQSLPGPLNISSAHLRKIGLGRNARYFNSGVLLFDWPKVKRKQHLKRCMDRVSDAHQHGKHLHLPDQDVLNLEFSGDWQQLNLRFNLMAFFVDYFPSPAIFRHFSNRQKPWGELWQPGFKRYRTFYREMFENSPWPEYAPGQYRRISLEGTGGILLRKLDPISGRRFQRHLHQL